MGVWCLKVRGMREVFESNYGFCSVCYSEEFTLFDVKFHLPICLPSL